MKKKSSLVEKKKKRKDTPTNPFWVRNFFLKKKHQKNWETNIDQDI